MKTRIAQKKWHGACIYKIREVTSPTHKEFRGFRFMVAVPNMNGHKPYSSEPAASFARAYLLFQSSDYDGQELDKKVQAHIRWLLNRGFSQVEPAEVFEARMLIEMSKGKTRHVELEQEVS